MVNIFKSAEFAPSPKSSFFKPTVTAQGLRDEWDKTVHHDWSSKVGGKNTIDKMTYEFRKGCDPTTYEFHLWKQYDSILPLATDNDVASGHLQENRPCRNDKSKVHKLACGHYVYSEHEAVPCGKNCEEANPDNNSFFCLLCARHCLDFTKIKQSRRWHDLLLPTFAKKDQELAWWLQESSRMRKVEPAYLDPYDFIILPRIHCTIAMLRAYEMRKEQELKAAIISLLAYKAVEFPLIQRIGMEFFEHCLVFQHGIDNADLRLQAALSVRAVLHHCNITDFNLADLMNAFGVPNMPKTEEFWGIIVKSMDDWAGDLIILDVMQGFTPQKRLSTDVRNAAGMAKRMWLAYTRGSETKFDAGTWQDRKRTVSWCLSYAFEYYSIRKTYAEILQLAGEGNNQVADLVMRGAMEDWVHGYQGRF